MANSFHLGEFDMIIGLSSIFFCKWKMELTFLQEYSLGLRENVLRNGEEKK